MYRTKDQVAQEIIAEGRRQGVSRRGIVIALAVGLVESGLVVYANSAVPGSLALPHDAVGSDGLSVGPLQQQVRQGSTGEWWWGPVEVCQDPTGSARLFFAALRKLAYDSATTDAAAGAIAQSVQKSAYPDRYAARMGDARAIYDRLTADTSTTGGTAMTKPDFAYHEKLCQSRSSRQGARVVYALGHTQEGDGTALSLADYLSDPSHDASYHYVFDNSTMVAVVDTDYGSWSVLDANRQSINFCFAGSRASWSRQTWIDRMRNGIRIAAWAIAEDVKKYPYINAKIVQARPYPKGAVPCVADHYFVTKVLGIGNHTDLGPNFPFDLLEADLSLYLGATPAPAAVNRINEAAAAAPWLGSRVKTGFEDSVGEVRIPDHQGRFAKFEHGYVYWHPRTGAVAVPNAIFETWAEHGYELGPLGYPTTAYTELPAGVVQAFEGGVAYRKTGAEHGFYVHGIIGARWAHDGFENGSLGWPTSDEYDRADGGRRQDFEHGSLEWDPSGAVMSSAVKVVAA